MNNQEVLDFAQPYVERFGWILFARSGNGNRTDDTYLYHFVDDAGINITINPVNKGFKFTRRVEPLFQLSSDEMTPLDYQNHFENNYLKFRKIVIEKNLK